MASHSSLLPPPQAIERFSTPARPNIQGPRLMGSVPPSNSRMVPPPSPYPFPQAAPQVPTPIRITAPGINTRPSPMVGPSGPAAFNTSISRGPMGSESRSRVTVGSDTRCSGGSNAKRDVSESQAWNEMMKAVHQSARKRRQGQPWSPPVTSSVVRPMPSAGSRRPLAFARHQARRQQLATGDNSFPSASFGMPYPIRTGRRLPSRSPSLPSDDEDEDQVPSPHQVQQPTQRTHSSGSSSTASTNPTSPQSRRATRKPAQDNNDNDDVDMQLDASPPIPNVDLYVSGVAEGSGSVSISMSLAEASSGPESASDEEEDWISASPSAARTRLTRPGTALARLTSSSDEATASPRVLQSGPSARSMRTASWSAAPPPPPTRSNEPRQSSEELNDMAPSSPGTGLGLHGTFQPRGTRKESRAGLPMPRRLFTKTASMPVVPRFSQD